MLEGVKRKGNTSAQVQEGELMRAKTFNLHPTRDWGNQCFSSIRFVFRVVPWETYYERCPEVCRRTSAPTPIGVGTRACLVIGPLMPQVLPGLPGHFTPMSHSDSLVIVT